MANKEAIQAWVDALRSGEYEQGQRSLKDEEGRYCCLGVLCEIAPDNVVHWDYEMHYFTSGGDDGNNSLLPRAVRDWAGLESDNPTLARTPHECEMPGCGPLTESASGLNDGRNLTFEQIADLVERKYLQDQDELPVLEEDGGGPDGIVWRVPSA